MLLPRQLFDFLNLRINYLQFSNLKMLKKNQNHRCFIKALLFFHHSHQEYIYLKYHSIFLFKIQFIHFFAIFYCIIYFPFYLIFWIFLWNLFLLLFLYINWISLIFKIFSYKWGFGVLGFWGFGLVCARHFWRSGLVCARHFWRSVQFYKYSKGVFVHFYALYGPRRSHAPYER